MKTIKKIKHGLLTLLYAVAAIGLVSCEADTLFKKQGELPDKETMETTYGFLRDLYSSSNEINISMFKGDKGISFNRFYYELTQPSKEGQSVTATGNPDLVEEYNKMQKDEYRLLPETNYEFPEGQSLDFAKGERRSVPKRIVFKSNDLDTGRYVLPLSIEQSPVQSNIINPTLYYNLKINEPLIAIDYDYDQMDEYYPWYVQDWEMSYKLWDGEQDEMYNDLFFVFYLNTGVYDPRLVDCYQLYKYDDDGNMLYRTIGNIINLKTVTIKKDASTGRALLNLSRDMKHVLGDLNTYIYPLQFKGRKVCLAIENSKDMGFCTLTDAQIEDFAAQVKVVVESCKLDGVNLWDKTEYTEITDKTSYPRLIKALREKLGHEKLVTVTVYEKPTEYFYDVDACGGIAVGDYINYAWSGYNQNKDQNEILDPWHPDFSNGTYINKYFNPGLNKWEEVTLDSKVSDYTQKPIAYNDPSPYGFGPSKFGYINFPIRPYVTDFMGKNIIDWREAGYKQSNILVCSDIYMSTYGEEGLLQQAFEGYLSIYSGLEWYYNLTSAPVQQYHKWEKDW